jgi:hypothetical protein
VDEATSINQVGFGAAVNIATGTTVDCALLWSGSAESAVNLSTFFTAGFLSSAADTIDASGDVFGTTLDSAGNLHAVEWVPTSASPNIAAVPEPASMLLALCGFFSLLAVIAHARRCRI